MLFTREFCQLLKPEKMKTQLLAINMFFLSVVGFAQESKLSLEVNYPIATGNNFIKENYTGVIDIGIRYKFAQPSKVGYGMSLHTSLYSNETTLAEFFSNKVLSVQPGLFIELDAGSNERFSPYIGVAYNALLFNTDNFLGIRESDSKIHHGLTGTIGFFFDISTKFYLNGQYSYNKVFYKQGASVSSFFTDISTLKAGVGYRF